ncbi:hypothetical protein BD626DRAFT_576462 [Schizophyllum amplum]|uniref:Uncharacterized protein n=1 Tax=Schizophyllum amplum TaxID=97359 RepID=A0A550BTE9_9AGAR|nr:hypothetical protein BD626DRAFT_576462 [Auriculariopsis ampla]
MPAATMRAVHALEIPEILSMVIEELGKSFDKAIRTSSCMGDGHDIYVFRCQVFAHMALVNWQWHDIVSVWLWRDVSLVSVLKLLPDDAWYFYDYYEILDAYSGSLPDHVYAKEIGEWSHAQRVLANPIFVLARPISEDEWKGLLRYTRHIHTLHLDDRQSMGPERAEWLEIDNVGLDLDVVYDTISRCLPTVHVFPKLKELLVHDFTWDGLGALRLFSMNTPQLTVRFIDRRLDDSWHHAASSKLDEHFVDELADNGACEVDWYYEYGWADVGSDSQSANDSG